MSKNRWVDSLTTRPDAYGMSNKGAAIIATLAFALNNKGRARQDELRIAGGLIRRWRKELGVATTRQDDHDTLLSDEYMIRQAIRCVLNASASPTDGACAPWLRSAEAVLRTRWKRMQTATA